MAKLIIYNIVLLFICHNKRSSSSYKFTRAFIGLSTLALGDYYAPFTRADIEQVLGHDVRTVRLEHTVLFLPFLAS